MNILHIDTEKYWRGGQQQVYYLHKALIAKGIKSILVCNKSSELSIICKKENLPFIEVNIFGELDIFAAFEIAKYCKNNKYRYYSSPFSPCLEYWYSCKIFLFSIQN